MNIMDRRQMNNPQLARERAVYDYLESLENGAIDGIIQSLQQAVHDAPLDQMLVDAHQAYFQEEQTQRGTLADIATRTDLPAPRPSSPHARTKQQKWHGSPWWVSKTVKRTKRALTGAKRSTLPAAWTGARVAAG